MELHCLKIARTRVGKDLPFDRIYLVKHTDRGVIKRLFRYAIVMPLREKLEETLQKLTIREEARVGFERSPSIPPHAEPPALETRVDFGLNWLVVVPLLPRTLRTGTRVPSYLTAMRWKHAHKMVRRDRARTGFLTGLDIGEPQGVVTGTRDAFDTQAYLQTPTLEVRPPCSLCPRQILRQAGECSLGDVECYQHLPLGVQAAEFTTRDDEDTVLEDALPGEAQP